MEIDPKVWFMSMTGSTTRIAKGCRDLIKEILHVCLNQTFPTLLLLLRLVTGVDAPQPTPDAKTPEAQPVVRNHNEEGLTGYPRGGDSRIQTRAAWIDRYPARAQSVDDVYSKFIHFSGPRPEVTHVAMNALRHSATRLTPRRPMRMA